MNTVQIRETIIPLGDCENKKAKVVHQDELLLMLGEKKHQVQFAYCCPVDIGNLGETKSSTTNDGQLCKSETCSRLLRQLSAKLSNEFSQGNIQDFEDHLQVESFHVSICLKNNCPYRLMDVQNKSQEAAFFCCSWGMADEKLAWKIISICQNLNVHQHKQGCL
ncbi:cleavage and polyadenylation specificity factor subunit 3-II [Prunus yedoensis var. nudiflora]|uniref:Cleavage and polyadenylation specificity factor subunit 3-II n=1 Tax=Prunus yedoensis var. nudiflora TaxID=2094558 RepID=A0A314ZAY4_PRUYE|nr:cleavage and polyadenylation specificity factor subunit 3-II [Prunus yedoensis var. nudiflora]